MRIIFCDSGFSPKEIDYMYAEEYEKATHNSISTSLISFEELKRGNVESSIKRVRANENQELGIYRGWMLKPNQYEMLYKSLLEKNIRLINNPTEYKFCHHFPDSYATIKDYTPISTFKEVKSKFDIDDFENELAVFDDKPIVVKDYVKSQKHYWQEACFIPDASDREKVSTVVNKFIELQDSDFNKGLVFREFVELEKLTNHSKSGMPLTKEFRIFVKDNAIINVFKYWDEGDYEELEPVLDEFIELLPKIGSNFFTMDIAKRKDGKWIIIELGDGQVAGLPDNANRDEFYKRLIMSGV